MGSLWPHDVDPPDRVLVAAESWGPLIDRWMSTTHCFIHLVSWMDPTWARKEAHELVLLAAYLARRDDAPDFWDVLRAVIVEYLSAGIPAYFDWLVERDEATHEVVAAMRRLPARDQVLLCLYDDDGRTSRYEEGRFRAADLALLFGIEPSSVARRRPHRSPAAPGPAGVQIVTDELDPLRAPVPVGVMPVAVSRHLAIDARSIVSVPRNQPSWRAPQPPDPLGVLEDPVFAPVPRRGGRSRVVIGVAAAVVVLVAVGVAAYVGGHDRGGDTRVAGRATSTMVATGRVSLSTVRWGYDPQVCLDDHSQCYTIGVDLTGYGPGQRREVACSASGVATGPARPVFVGADGTAQTRVQCPNAPGARSISVNVDGNVEASLDLPTRIEPTPTVWVTPGDPVAGQPDCPVPACRLLVITLTGFDPGAQLAVEIRSSAAVRMGTGVTVGPDGTATSSMYFGDAGAEVWAVADGIESNRLIWPPE